MTNPPVISKYTDWIFDNIVTPQGMCEDATRMMQEEFPELNRVRGYYRCLIGGVYPHWWLTSPDGKIIDPTVSQFASKEYGEYIPLDESQPEPTGRCHYCGGYTFNYQTCCSDECYTKYVNFCIS